MRFPTSHMARAALCLGLFFGLTGCDAIFGTGTDDSKNSLLAAARARKDAYDYVGAVNLLEKALEANPRLARAHWELALLHYQNTHDYASTVYHLQKLLVLDPKWKQTDDAVRIIADAKLELAKQAPFGPNTPQGQRLFSGMTTQIHQLVNEREALRAELGRLQASLQQLNFENQQLRDALGQARAGANPVPPSDPLPNPLPGANPRQPGASASQIQAAGTGERRASDGRTQPREAAPAPTLHTVRRGDTATAIARRYGINVRDLVRLNPNLNPSQIRAGESLRVR